MYLTSSFLVFSMVLGWIKFFQISQNHIDIILPLFSWIEIGELSVSWSIRYDMLTAVMIIVITTVSAMVHIYSIGYMSHDKSKPRFMSYLSLFTFAMLMLVTADNLIQLFFGWEGVGLASYLLIGFWYNKTSAHTAAMKAFIVNRVGDFGFILGIIAIYSIFGSVYFDEIFLRHHNSFQLPLYHQRCLYSIHIQKSICLLNRTIVFHFRCPRIPSVEWTGYVDLLTILKVQSSF